MNFIAHIGLLGLYNYYVLRVDTEVSGYAIYYIGLQTSGGLVRGGS